VLDIKTKKKDQMKTNLLSLGKKEAVSVLENPNLIGGLSMISGIEELH